MLERAERCLAMAAFYVLRDGDRHAPILEAMEREVERIRLEQPAARAKRILDDYKRSTGAPRRLAIGR